LDFTENKLIVNPKGFYFNIVYSSYKEAKMVRKFDVITFGSAIVDVFVDTGLREKGKFMAYPVGSKILLRNMKFDIGGGGTNTAVAFARFGLRTGYVGRLDSGFGGNQILEMLKNEKITFLGKKEKNSKIVGGYSVILDSKENDRTILTYKGISDHVKLSDIKMRKLKTRWLYLSSCLEESFESQKILVKMLHKRGVKIAFNPSDYLIQRKNLSSILKVCDILILNKDEAKMLAGSKERNYLDALRKMGPKIVVVTDKNKEVMAYDGEKKHSIVPHKVKVVERTGAGDAFASGFVAGIITGRTIKESLELGLEEGESVIRYFGAKNKLIRRNLK